MLEYSIGNLSFQIQSAKLIKNASIALIISKGIYHQILPIYFPNIIYPCTNAQMLEL